jgi:hypothetical protein
MVTASFCGLAWKCYNIPIDWTVGTQLVRHTLGLVRVCSLCHFRRLLTVGPHRSSWFSFTSGPHSRRTKSSVLLDGFTVRLRRDMAQHSRD